jgi:hypothetical protein
MKQIRMDLHEKAFQDRFELWLSRGSVNPTRSAWLPPAGVGAHSTRLRSRPQVAVVPEVKRRKRRQAASVRKL